MVDAVLTLSGSQHRGPIHVVSRHGYLSQGHAMHGHVGIDLDAFSHMPLRAPMRRLRELARAAMAAGQPWQWVMDSLREQNAGLWGTLAHADQRVFLRHVARQWDVHRHRIPPTAARIVRELLASGQLHRHSGWLTAVEATASALRVSIAPRRGGPVQYIAADRLIDCLGMQTDIRRVIDPVVGSMRKTGLIRPGPHGMGIDTDELGIVLDAAARARRNLYAIGSVRIGQLWESIAIPELRKQAAQLVLHACTVLARTHHGAPVTEAGPRLPLGSPGGPTNRSPQRHRGSWA